jgi:hypothetical protein
MTWPALIPSIIGILAALAVVLRAVPPAAAQLGKLADKIVSAFTRLVETHTSIYADMRVELADCKRSHAEQKAKSEQQDARIDVLEAAARDGAEREKAQLAGIEALQIALANERRHATAAQAEAEQLRRAIDASAHGTTTHRGDVR